MAEDDDYVTRRVRYLEQPSFTWSEFASVGMVKASVRALEQGSFDAASQVVDAMTRDDRIDGALQKRTEALPCLEVQFEKGKGRLAAKCQQAVEENWELMFPGAAIAELSKWGLMAGLGVGQIKEWADVGGLKVPLLKVWHPRFVYWRWDTRSFWINTMSGSVEMKHGDGQWVLYAPRGLERAFMMGRVRSLYVPWLVRQWAFRDWARFSEVHGLPIRKGFVPTAASDPDKERFMRELVNIGSETNIRLPRDQNGVSFDVELLEAKSLGGDTFGKLLSEANSCIAINILGQNLSTEVKAGSLAAANIHGDVEAGCVKRDGSSMAECLGTGVLALFAKLNFGDESSRPGATWNTEQPEDAAKLATTIKSLGDGITALNNAGVPVDADKLAERMDIPLREGESFEAQPPAAEQADKAAEAQAKAPQLPPGGPGLKVVGKKLSVERKPDPALEGQLFVDDLDELAGQAGTKALSADVDSILEALTEAKDLPGLRTALLSRFKGMSPAAFAKILESALMLSELNGRHAVKEELTDDA